MVKGKMLIKGYKFSGRQEKEVNVMHKMVIQVSTTALFISGLLKGEISSGFITKKMINMRSDKFVNLPDSIIQHCEHIAKIHIIYHKYIKLSYKFIF